MTCCSCLTDCVRNGHNRNGTQRYRCIRCRRAFSDPRWAVGNMYVSREKAALALLLLAEGNSIRSTARVAGIERNTVSELLSGVGEGCEALLRLRVRNVKPTHLEIDEVWTFVGKKQKRVSSTDPATAGDAYCFIALDRASRLVVTWHLGKRDEPNTARFITKIRDATKGSFQISSDAFPAYENAIETGLDDRVSYGRIVKVRPPGRVETVFGQPDLAETETTYVERFNGSLRLWSKRFTRATYAFSKKWLPLESRPGAPHRLLQLLPHPQNTQGHTRDGSQTRNRTMVNG